MEKNLCVYCASGLELDPKYYAAGAELGDRELEAVAKAVVEGQADALLPGGGLVEGEDARLREGGHLGLEVGGRDGHLAGGAVAERADAVVVQRRGHAFTTPFSQRTGTTGRP